MWERERLSELGKFSRGERHVEITTNLECSPLPKCANSRNDTRNTSEIKSMTKKWKAVFCQLR